MLIDDKNIKRVVEEVKKIFKILQVQIITLLAVSLVDKEKMKMDFTKDPKDIGEKVKSSLKEYIDYINFEDLGKAFIEYSKDVSSKNLSELLLCVASQFSDILAKNNSSKKED